MGGAGAGGAGGVTGWFTVVAAGFVELENAAREAARRAEVSARAAEVAEGSGYRNVTLRENSEYLLP